MDRKTEIGLIREIIGLAEAKMAYLDNEVTPSPISRYASEERFERELAMIFRRKPMIAAHSTDLKNPFDFITLNFMGLPILLTRDGEGTAQAFLNVCRHRGAKLEQSAEGCKKIFTCPYHAWSYDSKGALRSVPHEEQGFPDLAHAERGLRRLPVMEAHGFIWVIANPETAEMPDMKDWLAGLDDDLNWLGMSQHEVAVSDNYTLKANWKTLFEGGIEAYHFKVAHKETIAPYFPDNLSTYQMFGPHMRSILPRVSMPDLKNIPEEEWSIREDANIIYTLLPTTQFLVQQDHVVWIHLQPVSAGETKLRLATLVPSDAPKTDEMAEHWAKNHKITLKTLMEDFVLGEEIQSGFASKGNPSHLFGRFEGALNRFNLAIEEMISG